VEDMSEKQAVNPTNFDHIPSYSDEKEGVVNAVIETPALTRHKFAFEPNYGLMLLKHTLALGLRWPYDYGFIPQTLADDGDPEDILVLNDEPTFSGCMLEVRVLGVVRLAKNDVENDRIVGCPTRKSGVSLTTDVFNDIDDLPKELLAGIERFLVEYSATEGNKIDLKSVGSRKKALKLIEESRRTFFKSKDD
jgi:inorganic pyrophosphatase